MAEQNGEPLYAGTLYEPGQPVDIGDPYWRRTRLHAPKTLLDQLVLYSELEFYGDTPDRRQLTYEDGEIKGIERPAPGFLSDRLPWRLGDELEVMARGGLYDLERRRVMIAAENYASTVMGHRKSHVLGDYHLDVGPSLSVSVGPMPDDLVAEDQRENLPPATGLDRLTVHGNASMVFEERKAMMTGTVNKVWTGGITRMASMEGILCAGGFARVHAGSSATLAPLVSGDVYGAGLHAAACRLHLAGMGYRSADTATWNMGLYVRATMFTIIPAVGTPSKTKPPSSLAAKAFRIARGLLPFLDIGVGLAMLVPSIVLMIYALATKQVKPPSGPPRVLNRTTGVNKITANTDTTT